MTIIETTDATVIDEMRAKVDALETELKEFRSAAVVRSQPRVYGPNSDASYFQDIAIASVGDHPLAGDAAERLRNYSLELDAEIGLRSQEGVRAERTAAWVKRNGNGIESRAATSSTIAGFTTPEYLISDWATYRTPAKSFTDQTTKLPLTPYGLQINIPSFTGPATNVQQSAENTGVNSPIPTGANIPVNLVTIAGEVPISQQLSDRGGLSGLAFDKILMAQILANQDAAMDTYVINQAFANAYTTTWSSTASIPNFLEDLSLAREGLADTQGNRLLATHLFTTTDQFGYWSRQVDSSSNVPFIAPDSSSIFLAGQTGDPKWHSWTGVHIAGSLFWHTNDNIPANGSNTQLIVARPKEIYTFDGENIAFAYPETSAGTLSVQVGVYTYVGAVVRFPKCVAQITSNAYPTSNI